MTLRLLLGSFALIAVILLAPSQSVSADAAVSSGCKAEMVTYPDGSQKRLFAPPTPNGTLMRLGNRFRFTWRFKSLPAKCRPSVIALGLKFAPPLTILPFKRPVKGKSGTFTTFPIPATLASKVIYGQLWAEGKTGLLSDNRRVPLR